MTPSPQPVAAPIMPQYQPTPMQTQGAPGGQRQLTPQEHAAREAMRQQQGGGAGTMSSSAGNSLMGQSNQQGNASAGNQGMGQPITPQQQQQWQQFQQYLQQMQQGGGYPQQGGGYGGQPGGFQQGGFQGAGQQRMQQYGYGQPGAVPQYAQSPYQQTAPQNTTAGSANGFISLVRPGATVGATTAEQPAPQQLRAAPVMNAAQPAMNVQAPQVATPQNSLAQSRPVAAAPQLANNPVHQALGNPQLAMSDATKKVVSQRTLADDFLDHMKAYTYKYKDPGMEPRVTPTGGTYLGVMAQDLERIPHLGQQLVVETPHGKMVDQKTALSATMAGLARVNERLKAVEMDALKKGKK
jgi:hypothetical protein